ncbi:MAG: histidine phosphatase family protein [Bdellovibrionales bacterium]
MYFMRHGQSIFNERYDLLGRDPNEPDAPLSPKGKDQARAAGMRLQDKGFVRVVASPFTRAIETALLAAEVLNLSVEIEPLIGEYRLYSCDIGSPTSALRAAWPHIDFKDFHSEDWWLPFPEKKNSLTSRITAFRDKWDTHPDWGKTLFVSHYFFINAISDGVVPDNAEVVKV